MTSFIFDSPNLTAIGENLKSTPIRSQSSVNDDSFAGEIMFDTTCPSNEMLLMSESYFILKLRMGYRALAADPLRPIGQMTDNDIGTFTLSKNAALSCFSNCKLLLNNQTLDNLQSPAIIDSMNRLTFHSKNLETSDNCVIPYELTKNLFSTGNTVLNTSNGYLDSLLISNGLYSINRSDGSYKKKCNGPFTNKTRGCLSFVAPFSLAQCKQMVTGGTNHKLSFTVDSNWRINLIDIRSANSTDIVKPVGNTSSINTSQFAGLIIGNNRDTPSNNQIMIDVDDFVFIRTTLRLSENPVKIPRTIQLINNFIQFHTLTSKNDTWYAVIPKGCIRVSLAFVPTGRGRLSTDSSNSQTAFDTGVVAVNNYVRNLINLRLRVNNNSYPNVDYNLSSDTELVRAYKDFLRESNGLSIDRAGSMFDSAEQWNLQKLFHWRILNGSNSTEEQCEITCQVDADDAHASMCTVVLLCYTRADLKLEMDENLQTNILSYNIASY